MQDLIQFHEKPIRHIEEDGIRWFMVRDVCEALEISWRGSETTKVCDSGWVRYRASATLGGQQEVVVCTDRGMLAIGVAHSTRFRTEFINWFYDKVLPVVQAQQKLPMVPPPTYEERLISVTSALPVSVGVKHPGRIIGRQNRRLTFRVRRWIGQILELQSRIEDALSMLQKGGDR